VGLICRSAVYHNLTPSVVNHVNRHILALNVESLLVQLRSRGEPGGIVDDRYLSTLRGLH
jgi:hypothetical protein